MITRSKKIKTTVNINPQTSNVDGIPLDLVIEIIGRLPAKSVARFLLVSKLWARIIRSPDFIRSFPFGSSSQPRLLIAFGGVDRRGGYIDRKWDPRLEKWNFFSSTLSSSFFLSHSHVTCPLPYPEHIEYHSHYVNGLLSFGYGQEQFIVNPATGKCLSLPRVKTRRMFSKSFFGYDPVNDEYKVLCMTEKLYGGSQEPSSQHQVFTLGAKRKKSWRMIECSHPHRPCSNGVCIDGVVYYVSNTGTDLSQRSIIRFDLRSEKLDLVTGVPAGIVADHQVPYGLIFISNYEGKVAIPFQTTSYTFDVWIMDQNAEKHEWVKKITFNIEPWNSLFPHFVRIRAITQTGEFILAPFYYKPDDVYVVHYNPNTDSFRKTKVEVNAYIDFRHPCPRGVVFSDYVESVRFL